MDNVKIVSFAGCRKKVQGILIFCIRGLNFIKIKRLGLQQKATRDTPTQEGELPDVSIAVSSHRPWVQMGSLMALTTYIGQLSLQILIASGFYLGQTHSIGAMESNNHDRDKFLSFSSGSSSNSSEGQDTSQAPVHGQAGAEKPREQVSSSTSSTISLTEELRKETLAKAPCLTGHKTGGVASTPTVSSTTTTTLSSESHDDSSGNKPPYSPSSLDSSGGRDRPRNSVHQQPSLDPRREALLQNIIKTTQAEYDWPGHVLTTLGQILPTLPEGDPLKDRLSPFTQQVKQPEDLLFFGPGETQTILYRKGLNRSQSAFGTFRSLIERIDLILLPDLDNNLSSDFQNLKAFYEGYIDALCRCEDTPDQKEYLLAQKVFLKLEKPLEPKETPVKGAGRGSAGESPPPQSRSYGFYRISQEMARQLISKDRYGFSDKKNKTGMRAVQSQGGVHFKFLDSSLDAPRPGMEYMAYAFATALTSPFSNAPLLVTPSVLFKLEGVSLFDPTDRFPSQLLEAKQKGESLDEALARLHLQGDWKQFVQLKDHNCFVQASQTIGNKNLGETLKENPGFQGDPVNLGWQVLFSLLTAPGDGKADNYSVDEKGNHVIGIDNDKIFYPPLYQTKTSLYTGINCVLYLLGSLMDTVLPNDVRESFLALNPSLTVLNWLGSLQDQNTRYQQLATLGILNPADLKTLGLPICLPAGLPEQISKEITHLQFQLQDRPTSTPSQLLFSLSPVVARYYQTLREQYQNDPLAAMWVIYKGRDEAGTLQTVDKVLSLSSDDPSWKQASTKRTNSFATDLSEGIKTFMAQIPKHHLEGNFNALLSLLLTHFAEEMDNLLPILPENAWHQVIQEQSEREVHNTAILNYLYKRDPEGINSLNRRKLSPLDIAFDYIKDATHEAIVIDLINKGAWEVSLSGRRYRNMTINRDKFSSAFWEAFAKLKERNAKVRWTVTLEELFPITSKQGENTIRGTSGETRLLTETILEQLKDPHREVKEGRRKVIQVAANGCFAYLKLYPELVGIEEAVGELTRRTIGFGAPYGELFRLPNTNKTPVWISQGIPGKTLQWVVTNDPGRLTSLDPVSTTQFILMAMLVNPEDGKPDNYIVEPLPGKPNHYRLSSPDNDHGFVPAYVKTKPHPGNAFKKPELVVQVKTILYCLDLMNQPIPEETKALFLKGDPLVLMEGWLDVLDRRNRSYASLYDSNEASALFKSHECFLGVPFQKGMIGHLYSKWVRFQDCLWDKSLTPLELLSKVEPRLANRYREAFNNPQNKTLWDRFKQVDGIFYHQTGSHLRTLTPSGSILTSQNIPMQESALESIRNGQDLGPKQAIAELQEIVEQNNQTGLSIQHVKTDAQREVFLKEFEFGLYEISEQRRVINQLTTQISQGARLINLTLKNCAIIEDSVLRSHFLIKDLVRLDLNGCQQVTQSIIPLLSQMPGLEILNLSNLPKLRWVADAGYVNYGPLSLPQLRTLNLNNCPALEAIDIDAPKLTDFWAQGAKKLNLLKLKAAIDDEVFYSLLGELEALNLNLDQVDLAGCPNVTAGAKKILAFCLNPAQKSLDLSGTPIGLAGATALSTRNDIKTLTIDSDDLVHLWEQPSDLGTVQVKGKMMDEELYGMFAIPTNLKVVDLNNCPNITKSARKDLSLFLNPLLNFREGYTLRLICSDEKALFQYINQYTLVRRPKLTYEDLYNVFQEIKELYATCQKENQATSANKKRAAKIILIDKMFATLQDVIMHEYPNRRFSIIRDERSEVRGRNIMKLINKYLSQAWYQKVASQKDSVTPEIIALLAGDEESRYDGIWQMRLFIPIARGGYEEIYQQFLNGRLIYKPNKDNDIGKIELPIAALANPLEGTFDLSKCGDTAKYLSISTGYKKGKKPENKDKLEIWFVPRFLVEKEINGDASHFKEIFPDKWPDTVPVGIIWTWSNDDLNHYDYLTSEDFEHISNDNLYEKWRGAQEVGFVRGGVARGLWFTLDFEILK